MDYLLGKTETKTDVVEETSTITETDSKESGVKTSFDKSEVSSEKSEKKPAEHPTAPVDVLHNSTINSYPSKAMKFVEKFDYTIQEHKYHVTCGVFMDDDFVLEAENDENKDVYELVLKLKTVTSMTTESGWSMASSDKFAHFIAQAMQKPSNDVTVKNEFDGNNLKLVFTWRISESLNIKPVYTLILPRINISPIFKAIKLEKDNRNLKALVTDMQQRMEQFEKIFQEVEIRSRKQIAAWEHLQDKQNIHMDTMNDLDQNIEIMSDTLEKFKRETQQDIQLLNLQDDSKESMIRAQERHIQELEKQVDTMMRENAQLLTDVYTRFARLETLASL